MLVARVCPPHSPRRSGARGCISVCRRDSRGHLIAALATSMLAAMPIQARADELDEGVRFKSVGLQGNPLGLAIGRYSADIEYLPEAHHALHLTIFGYYAVPGV